MNLIVVDTNAFAHIIMANVEKNLRIDISKTRILTKEVIQEINLIIYSRMKYLLNGGDIIPYLKGEPFHIIFATDNKPYWREKYLAKVKLNYKGKRQNQPQRASFLGYINSRINYVLMNWDLSIVQMSAGEGLGYEADDIASGICHLVNRGVLNYDRVFLHTDDNDWLGLVNEKINWVGIHYRQPKYRDLEIAIDFLQNKWNDKTKTKARRNYQINVPSDIYKFKCTFGDISDNIPGDALEPHLFMPFVSLIEPKIKIWEEDDFLLRLQLNLEKELVTSERFLELFS